MVEKVLLVDDEKDFLEVMAERMAARGIEVSTASSATEAIRLAEKESFDAIIVDLMMPEMDGIEALKLLKKKKPETQVILLTGHATLEKGIEAMKLGAVDFLEKPYDNELLITRIRQCLREISNEQDRESKVAKAKSRLAQLTPRELEVMNLLVAGKHNKIIANELNISVRTAEAHRAKVMKKLQADSLSDIVRIAMMR